MLPCIDRQLATLAIRGLQSFSLFYLDFFSKKSQKKRPKTCTKLKKINRNYMQNQQLKKNILNLNDSGVSMFVPFLKQIVCEDKEKYDTIDGYQAAILSMNLNPFIKLSHTDSDKINESDEGFLESFNIILSDQEVLLDQAYKEFSVLMKRYLESDDENIDKKKFKENMFRG